MRLRERDKQPVVLRERVGDDDLYKWTGAGVEFRATVYPLTDELSVQQYGEEVNRMRLLLYDRKEPRIAIGMGLCVDVPGDESCDYRVKSVDGWAHQRAVLERIPKGLRG